MLAVTFMSLLSLFIPCGEDQSATSGGDGSYPATTVRKLCDAAWASVPKRFDILLYQERMLKQMSPQDVEKMVKDALDATTPKDASVSPSERKEMIQYNVEQIKKEQKVPRRIIQRVRQDGERRRIDMTILKPDQDVFNARLSDSIISLGKGVDANGRSRLEISGMARVANILPTSMEFAGTPVEAWLSVPYRMLVYAMFGAPGEASIITRSDERVAKFLTGEGGEAIRLRPVHEPRVSSSPLDRIEVFNVATGQVLVSILCDQKNYGRVYEVVFYNPTTSQPSAVLKRGGYLPNGVATELESSTYDERGNMQESDKAWFLSCNFNPVFKPNDFVLEAPPGYGLVDTRATPQKTISHPDPTTAEHGDIVREILGTAPSDALVARNLARAGLSIPAPGAR